MKIMETSVNLHSFSLVWPPNTPPSLEIKMRSEAQLPLQLHTPFLVLPWQKEILNRKPVSRWEKSKVISMNGCGLLSLTGNNGVLSLIKNTKILILKTNLVTQICI